MRISIAQPTLNTVSETFLRAHAEQLRNVVGVIDSMPGVPAFNGQPILNRSLACRVARKISRMVRGQKWDSEVTNAYVVGFERLKCDVVLAQYGPTGVAVMDACERVGIPFVVHFHGFDTSRHDLINDFREKYSVMFERASAVVAVSIPMYKKLVDLGAPPDRIYVNHYGVDVKKFIPSEIELTFPLFLAVGRLVEKKAPHLTILAFAKVQKEISGARLLVIGDGPLRKKCEDLIQSLGLEQSVELLGAQSHDRVIGSMRDATAFVQHSIEAASGDCEGLPNSILEAAAAGLPVIATRHAGIPEAVIDGQTGFLVNENDVDGMAAQMLQIAGNPAMASRMGRSAREYMSQYFAIEKSICKLSEILQAAVSYHRNKSTQTIRG